MGHPINIIANMILIIVNIKSFILNNLRLFHWYEMLLRHTQLNDIHALELVTKLQNTKY